MEFKFDLLEKETVGKIILSDKVRVSDPCYTIDTWCAGTLENVLEGKYKCFSQKVDCGDWGIRIASIEVRHEDYLNIEPTELQDIDVGVDSGQAGIYDLDYFIENRKDKHGDDKWYWRVCDSTYGYFDNPDYIPFEESEFWKDDYKLMQYAEKILSNELERCIALANMLGDKELTEKEKEYIESINVLQTKEWYDDYCEDIQKYHESKQSVKKVSGFAAATLDDKCLVSSSGDGDGGYHCLVGRNDEGKIVSIKIDYYYGYEDEEE